MIRVRVINVPITRPDAFADDGTDIVPLYVSVDAQ